jgi:hypothetical protein
VTSGAIEARKYLQGLLDHTCTEREDCPECLVLEGLLGVLMHSVWACVIHAETAAHRPPLWEDDIFDVPSAPLKRPS